MSSKSAIVLGASGVSGWAFVNQLLLDHPAPETFKKVHALFNRYIPPEKTLWPRNDKLNVVSGVDLLNSSVDDLKTIFRNQIPGVETVTHAYFLAYKASSVPSQEVRDNDILLRNAITALDAVAPSLEFVVLQHGGRYYGLHLLENRPQGAIYPPYREDMPMIPQPFRDELFYYAQIGWLQSFSAAKTWGWCETRPDIVIGFTPAHNPYNLAVTIGIFCSLFREIHGEGAECPFPGTTKSWDAVWSNSSSDMLARQAIHISLTEPWCHDKGEAFNTADSRAPSTWSHRWPLLCSYFGLKGVKLPTEDPVEMRAFIRDNRSAWEAAEKRCGLEQGFADRPFQSPTWEYVMMSRMDFDRPYDVSKVYATGFSEERDTMEAWGPVFDRLKRAKIIPGDFE